MSTIAIIGLMVGGTAAFGGLLLWAALEKTKRAAQLEERNAETQRQNAAKARADAVLAEHRDPDGIDERLRRHDI